MARQSPYKKAETVGVWKIKHTYKSALPVKLTTIPSNNRLEGCDVATHATETHPYHAGTRRRGVETRFTACLLAFYADTATKAALERATVKDIPAEPKGCRTRCEIKQSSLFTLSGPRSTQFSPVLNRLFSQPKVAESTNRLARNDKVAFAALVGRPCYKPFNSRFSLANKRRLRRAWFAV